MDFLKAIRFHNYKAFVDAELPLEPLTLLIGPNASGKTSALSAIHTMSEIARERQPAPHAFLPIGVSPSNLPVLEAVWDSGATRFVWAPNRPPQALSPPNDPKAADHLQRLKSGRVFAIDLAQVGATVPLLKTVELADNGGNLPAVLTTLQDKHSERLDALNADLRKWLPEYDRIVFDTPQQGQRAIALRTVHGRHEVPTSKLSAGTLLSLALLSISHLPDPPAIIGLEEPDHGLHPRLLRNLKDSLLRLTSPSSFGDQKNPVQVVVTTHSPYLVDLFRDELESVVVVHKDRLHSSFSRLSDMPHVADIVKDAALGEAWYSGLLGGVPVES